MNQKENETDLIVLVDMDGVMADFVGGWRRDWNKKYPDRQITEECTDFYVENAFAKYGTSEELIEIFHRPDFFFDLEPLPGAIDGIRQMQNCGISTYICTSPSSITSWGEKAEWVEHYLGSEWLRRLIITKDKTLIQADYLLDDKPEITGLIGDPTWEHVIYDQPYNQDITNKFRITWKTWPSLLFHASKRAR